MNNKRYMIIRGLHGEIEDIIDHCKQDKHLGFSDFMIQINEQDKAFKKLKKENMELKNKIEKKNEYQRVLEGKITRLKDRVKTLEKKE